MDERNTNGPANTGSAASRHRLDSGGADKVRDHMRPMGASPVPQMPSIDGPRAVNEANTKRGVDGVGMHVDCLPFEAALGYLRGGARVARAGWNGKGQYIQCQFPDINSKMSLPYIFIRTVQGDLVPWLASQTDLLAWDWCLVREVTTLQYGSGAEA